MKQFRADFFTNVYASNLWKSEESVSGYGSDAAFTREISAELPLLLKRLQVQSFLDVPCGDFNWMKNVDLGDTQYIGGDIVPAIVELNRSRYSRAGVRFEIIDLVKDDLPEVEMVFVRDCFIHFSLDLIFEALRNIARSNIRYVCLTHDMLAARYAGNGSQNIELDRAVEGVNFEFRPINFLLKPFSFPEPLDLAKDGPALDNQKVMAVWDTHSLKAALLQAEGRSA